MTRVYEIEEWMSERTVVKGSDLEREIYDELRTISGHLKAIQYSAAWVAFLLTIATVVVVFRGFAT